MHVGLNRKNFRELIGPAGSMRDNRCLEIVFETQEGSRDNERIDDGLNYHWKVGLFNGYVI